MRNKKFFIVMILGMMSAIGPFSIDMYLPGFPAIASDLNTTVAHISLSLSSFFIGISLGQLLYGPLLDRYGRKRPLYFGLSLYIAASIGCAVATSADALIVLRLFQALGGCVGMVASRALVRDIFPVEENAKVFSLLMLVIGVSPIIAPTLGGYVTASLGWHWVFVVLTLMGVFNLVAVHFFLPEGRKADKTLSLAPPVILRRFRDVLKEPQFYTYALTGSIASAGLYAYISGSPYVFMEIFRVSEKQYGWIFALIALGLIGSSQVNSVLLRNFTSQAIVKVALFCQASIGLVLFVFTWLGWLEVFSTIFLIFIFLCSQGFTFPNTSALSLAPFSKTAGSASALLGSIQMAIGATMSALVSMLSNHTALPMTGVMAGCAVTSLTILLIGSRVIRFKANQAVAEEKAVDMIRTT
ncbi:multidrug effflux MFS transporter [Aridibaculum aurantiacum]|uniref:multidrug effflux MFS transporter n=1 Tax=Aridibaculum aurantiacum TaxID=2810307 RepID=UPI001A9597A0|nr:multidrug effflux MFS transporter [Aridibaculum aurantiacum]